MDAMTGAGRGWVNIEPEVDEDDLPPPGTGIFRLFSAKGPDVPLATWTAPITTRRGRREPAMVGLQHGAGSRVKALLAASDHPVPEGWRVVQDYVRKGLVVAVPPDAPNAEVLRWLLAAAATASSIPVGPWWRATVYDG